jgi:Skp family chaperone for outer membrane proteins
MRKRVSEAHAEFTAFHDTLIENKSNVKDITGEIVKFREHDFEKLQDQIRGIVEVSKKIESFQSGLSSDLSMAKFKEEFNKILKVLAFCAKDGKTLTTKLVSNIEKQLINLNDLLKSDKESVFTTIKKIETHFSELSLKDFFGEIDSAGAISIAFKEEFKQFDEIVQSHNEELKKIHDGLDKLLYDILEDH